MVENAGAARIILAPRDCPRVLRVRGTPRQTKQLARRSVSVTPIFTLWTVLRLVMNAVLDRTTEGLEMLVRRRACAKSDTPGYTALNLAVSARLTQTRTLAAIGMAAITTSLQMELLSSVTRILSISARINGRSMI